MGLIDVTGKLLIPVQRIETLAYTVKRHVYGEL
jgi:hypothetical protein